MKRLPAFTLLEALLALLLLAVLGGMAAMVLGQLRSVSSGVGNSFARDEELLHFCTAARNDIERANRLKADGTLGLRCEGPLDTVRYALEEGSLIRHSTDGEERFELGVAGMDLMPDREPSLVALWRIRFTDRPRLPVIAFRKAYSPADRQPDPDADTSLH